MQLDIHDAPTGRTLVLRGDLDAAAAQVLDGQLGMLVDGLEAGLVVDLGGVGYLGSTGIRSFIRLDRRLAEAGRRLAFRNAPPNLVRIFRYCGLESYFTFEGGADAPPTQALRIVPAAHLPQGA